MGSIPNIIRERASRLLRSRTAGFAAGTLLLLVPTLFTVFPRWGHWDILPRVLVMGGWLVAAMLVVYGTTRQSAQIHELVGAPQKRRDLGRLTSGGPVIQAVLSPGHLTPDPYPFPLYPYADRLQKLLPSYEQDN